MRSSNRRWTIVGIATLTLLAVVPVTAALKTDSAQATTAQPGDGTSSSTAGASCWGIKQQHPRSASGTYWLLTGSMDRPAQFACDMTTQGGGWVLVARGRNGWTFNPNGQGSPATIRDTIDGPDAFAPAALGTTAIDELIDTGDLSSLPDGIRLERSTTADGSVRQDYRLFPKARTWTWNLGAGQLLNKVTVGGATYNGSNTKDTSAGVVGQTVNQLSGIQDTRRIFTTAWTNHRGQMGFGLGSAVPDGSNAATNHLWTATTEGSPLGFTRVWLRPQIANSAVSFTPIPAGGFEAEAQPLALKNRSELAPWGVSGYNHVNEDSVTPWQDNVMVIKVYGDRVYVGGRFTGVQQGPGATPVAQASIAAFDLDGNWISTFRPTVVGRVWDMTMTNDGKLIIGGDFTSVDGLPDTAGLAALDPATGAVNAAWKGSVTRTGGNAIVRALDSRGDWIYAAGRFSRFKGGASNPIAVTSAISMKASNGGPGTWRPKIYATAVRIRVSEAGDRVYLAGFFNAVNTDTNHGFQAITDPTTGAVEPGIGRFQPSEGSLTNNWYQQAVAESGDNILVGGAQHDFQMYDHNRNTLIDSHITKRGGDFQAIEVFDGYAYAACHCMNWNYSGSNSWSNPRDFRAVDPIRMVGRWNAETLDYDTTWYPNGTKGINDAGIWSIAQDRRKCLWVGGDLIRGAYSGNAATDYLGGFARFCPTDPTVPTAPSNLKATTAPGSVELDWSGSTDDSGSVSYDVYRNDRVIATVFGTTFSDTTATGAVQYTVRAADARGNRSASPTPIAVNGPAPTIDVAVAYGATWSYVDTGTDLGTGWTANGFDDAGWATGAGTLGWGGTQATTIGAAKPITTYFRSTFEVADPSEVKILDLVAGLAQGAVLYVNSVEVGRVNMPAGTVTATTLASAYTSGTEDARAKAIRVPGNLLRSGTNSIAVEVHAWKAGATNVFFDLQATARGANADTTAPTAPTLSATSGADGISLAWTPSTDDENLGGYVIRRDGSPIAVTASTATSYLDPALDGQVPHTYVVTAFDLAGNATNSSVVTVAPSADTDLLAFGSTWNWWYQAAAPATGWQAETYDTTGWKSGPGELGFGDTPKTTVISTAPAPRPVTSYYRTTVDIDDPVAFDRIAIDLVRNAGAVVYVNGVEVGRSNMRDGVVTHTTYAPSVPTVAQRHVPVRLEALSSAFHAGTNTIAVEVHLNYRSQPTTGFDLALTGLPQAGRQPRRVEGIKPGRRPARSRLRRCCRPGRTSPPG